MPRQLPSAPLRATVLSYVWITLAQYDCVVSGTYHAHASLVGHTPINADYALRLTQNGLTIAEYVISQTRPKPHWYHLISWLRGLAQNPPPARRPYMYIAKICSASENDRIALQIYHTADQLLTFDYYLDVDEL